MVDKVGITAVLNSAMGDKMLEKAARSLENREQILSMLSRFAREWERDVFSSNGAIAGKAWAALAPSTVELKGSNRPDVQTGSLMSQLTGEPKKLKYSIQLRTSDRGKYLAKGRYYNENAADQRGGNMPKRNPAPKPPKERLGRLLAEMLDGVMDDARS